MADTSKQNYEMHGKREKTTVVGYEYAFYKYQRNGGTKSIQDQEIDNFSLSLLTTSLSSILETDLRQFISKRVSKGSIYEGQGNISAIVIGGTGEEEDCSDSLCYYCLLRRDQDELHSLLEPQSVSDQFILCLLTDNTVALDLFRTELDRYSRKLVDLLEADLLLELELREELGQLDGVDDRLQQVLSQWYPASTQYLCKCVRLFGQDVRYLIYCALSDIKLDIQCSDQQLTSDILRFVECCSLSQLLSTLKSSEPQLSDSSCSDTGAVLVKCSADSSLAADTAHKTSLVIDNNGHRFHNCGCTALCEEWAAVLVNGEAQSAVFIKQISENYKLRSIQDMNTLKRLLKQAETDYYALYRCYDFVSSSGNEAVLLRHAHHEAATSGHRDTLNVLAVIRDFTQRHKQALQPV